MFFGSEWKQICCTCIPSARRNCSIVCHDARYFWRLRSRPLRAANVSRSLWKITQSSKLSCLLAVGTGASTCLEKKCLLSLSRSSLNADASLKKFVRRMFFIAHNEPVIPWTYLICLDCLRSLQSPIAHPAHPQSLS